MIKNLCAFLLLLCVPTFCFAEWVGEHDGRRYVTDTEKSQYPYNLVVRIDLGDSWATGTFVSPHVILTCRHCIAGLDVDAPVDFYTTDGVKHTGKIGFFKVEDKMSSDFALIVTQDAQKGGHFSLIPSASEPDPKAIRLGYDSLKILSDEEIAITHRVFEEIVEKYGTITRDNVWDALDDIEYTIYAKWKCKSDTDTNCVRCDGEGCLFNDGERLKVQDSCSATALQKVQDGGQMIMTRCAVNQGGSGGPLLSHDASTILGVIVGAAGFELGAKAQPNTLAVKAEEFSKPTEDMIRMTNTGLITY